ncbi:MAG: ATP-binding protein [Ruminococcus sp.]|nr:ATP-binding protein [Ruminococcus sp.]
MQKKIFRSMTLLVSVTLVIFASLVIYICWSVYRESAFSELETAALIAVDSSMTPQEISESLSQNEDYSIRVTYIQSDGTVAFDNQEDAEEMENHADREEVKQALETGSGSSERLSQTLDKTYCYYAVAYDGGVLRLARTRNSMLSITASVILFIVAAVGVLIVITTIISMRISDSVMSPIRRLVRRFDLSDEGEGADEPKEDSRVYEELVPIFDMADKLLDESHRIVRRLKKEKEKFVLITENMAEGMILLDSDKTVLSVNRTALELFNPDFDPSLKLTLADFTTDEQLWGLVNQLEGHSSVRGVITLDEHSWRVFANQTEYAGKYGIVIILADVTESIKSEQIRRDFSANVSHELKTPLTTIKGFGEMMEKGIISKEEDVKRYGGTIYRESARLLSLINDIIRLSEIEDGEAKALFEQVDLLKAALSCAEILQVKADESKVEIRVSGESALIMANKSYINEMILNLMDNSIKYNRAGGWVSAEITALESKAQIVIADNGIGISEADKERVFERFYRVDKSRSKATGGTGLGLSIVKHMVAVHNGELKIESGLGKGTKITILLPYENEDLDK